MYAVIKTGGKQYKVATVVIDKVLMISDDANTTIGAPLIAGATVSATVLSHGRADKVMIFKFRRRKHYRKTQGHRQSFTEIQIGEILAAGASAAKAAPKATKAKAAKAAE